MVDHVAGGGGFSPPSPHIVYYGVPFVSKLSNVSILTEQSMFSQESMFARHLAGGVWLSNRYLSTAVAFSLRASIFSLEAPIFSFKGIDI